MVSVRDIRAGDSGTPRNGAGALSMIGAAAEIAEALQAIDKKGDHPFSRRKEHARWAKNERECTLGLDPLCSTQT